MLQEQTTAWAAQTADTIQKLTIDYSLKEKGNLKTEKLLNILKLLPAHITSEEEFAYHRQMFSEFVAFCEEQVEHEKKSYFMPKAWEDYKKYLKEKYNMTRSGYYTAVFMPLGISLGLPFGVPLGNIALGIPIGLALGLAIGASKDASAKKKVCHIKLPADTQLPTILC